MVQRIVERALADEVTALVGRARYERRQVATPDADDGGVLRVSDRLGDAVVAGRSYERTLLTIPRRSGCGCRGSVASVAAPSGSSSDDAPYERSWGDVQAWARS